MISALIISLAGGFARAAAGSGNTQWWSSRGVLYPAWMLLCGFLLHLGSAPLIPLLIIVCLSPLPLWFPLDIRWEEAKKLALWWSVPGLVSVILLIFLESHLFSPTLLYWPVAAFLIGLGYSQLKSFAAARGWSDRVPEFIAGFVVIGGAGLILV